MPFLMHHFFNLREHNHNIPMPSTFDYGKLDLHDIKTKMAYWRALSGLFDPPFFMDGDVCRVDWFFNFLDHSKAFIGIIQRARN
jgi:hypothetical protein